MVGDGEDDDFESWYRDEHPTLVRSLWLMSGDRELALDVVGEAFSRALARWDRVSAMASPGGWVRTVAVNLLRRGHRRRRREQVILASLHGRTRMEAVIPDLDLWDAVATLPSRQREVVALRYLGGCTEAEVAACLGISEGAASASLVKARLRLAELLDPSAEVSGNGPS